MFALIQSSQITALVPEAPSGTSLDYRLVVDGTAPTLTTAYSSVVERPVAEWTIQASQVVREFAEYIPSGADQTAIQTARDVLPLLPKRKKVMEILRDALASETEPDFTPAGVTTSAIALPSHITGSSGLNQTQVDARVNVGIAAQGLGTAATTAAGDYAPAAHAHAFSAITGKPTTLAGYGIADAVGSADARLTDARTPSAHTHAQSEITNLVADLAGKSSTSHAHAGVYQPLATVLTNTTASFTTALESKLGGVAAGATANATDAQLRDRTTHTGADATVVAVAPATGATQTFNITKADQLLALTHSATIAAQTLVFPTDVNSQIGQVLRVYSRSIVTTVTLTLNSNTIYGTALTTLALNGNAAWQKIGASLWARIQ